jgi:hypothetical protein
MFRFSIRMVLLGIVAMVAMVAMGGVFYCRWSLRRNSDKATLAGPISIEATPLLRKTGEKSFNLDYAIQEVGPEGVAEVQLWGTKDEGSTWEIWGYDRDLTSPVFVHVYSETRYGFCIVVVGKNGLSSKPPASGEAPDIWIDVAMSSH